MNPDPYIKLATTIGVLLHPTALPGSPVCGSFGKPSRDWVQALARNKIGLWQILPLAPTDATGSPYCSPSSFAFNPAFLDVNDLVREGFLSESILGCLPVASKQEDSLVNFQLIEERTNDLGKHLGDQWSNQVPEFHIQFEKWCSNQFWLEDHICFMELKRQYNGLPWWEWPKELALHHHSSLLSWRKENQRKLLEHSLLQWHLDRQWKAIRELAKDLDIRIFGDVPFYVSRDSSDVWCNRSLFSISADGELDVQSGVPPDYFSSTGQLWGTPVYRWKEHSGTNFSWWRKRFSRHWEQVDILRLDHFRALESYWEVPGTAATAEEGSWQLSPGKELLNFLQQDCKGELPLIAEDLGIITPEVESLRDQFGLLGMKILQFAFDGNSDNPYLPQNIIGNRWAVYTGTHDNPTTLSWWESLGQESQNNVLRLFKSDQESPVWNLIRLALETDARLVVVPVQDLLCLTNEARFNTPGTTCGNWSWRLSQLDKSMEHALRNFGELSSLAKRSRN